MQDEEAAADGNKQRGEEAAGGNKQRGEEEEAENLTSPKEEKPEGASGSSSCEEKGTRVDFHVPGPVLSIVISQPEEKEKGEDKAAAAKKGFLPRSESYHELCRVCQQQTEEVLVDLGCRCRGELAKAHRSCIDIWFRTRGSNKCEICQHVAVNVPPPVSLPSTNYWVWRIDAASGGSSIRQGEHGCFSPLWVAFSILIGGLLLDVLISVSLRVSALPVKIIIGVLIVLGLGTAFRLALECCHEWSLRRNLHVSQTTVNTANPAYLPTV